MRNIKVSIRVGFSETEESVTANECVEQGEDGSFSLVLGEQDEFNIDRLENALLQTSYPALRAGLSEHLGQAVKKSLSSHSLSRSGQLPGGTSLPLPSGG